MGEHEAGYLQCPSYILTSLHVPTTHTFIYTLPD